MNKTNPISHHLFDLIHSMTKSEKRYFRIMSGKEEDKVYIKLFELIDKQSHYNEKEIKNDLKNKDTLKNFHVAKKYLFELIMKSLIAFHHEINADARAKQLIQQIGICNSKGLFQISQKLIKIAEKHAEKYELHYASLEISELKKDNMSHVFFNGYSNNDVRETIEKEKNSITEIQKKTFYKTSITNLFAEYIKWSGIKNPEKNTTFKELENTPLFVNENPEDSYEVKWMQYLLKGFYHFEKKDYAKSRYYREKNIALAESKPFMLKSFKRNYIVILHNYLIELKMAGDYQLLEAELEKFKLIETKYFAEDLEKFRRYYLIKLQYLVETGQFEEGVNVEKEFLKRLPEFQQSISKALELMIKFYIARCYHGIGKFDKTLDILLEISTEKIEKESLEILGLAHLWTIITHFDMGNKMIIPYLTHACEHFYQKYNLTTNADNLILQFFKASNKRKMQDSKNKLVELKSNLAQSIENINDRNLNYKSVLLWIESKISGRKLSEIIQTEKADADLLIKNKH